MTKQNKNKFNVNDLKIWVAYWNSNGTNDIIFTDNDYQVIGGLDEALFGFKIKPDALGNYVGCLDGKDMILVDSPNDSIELCHYESIDYDLCLKKLTVSPMRDWDDAIKRLNDAIKDALK